MSNVNIRRAVENIRTKTTAYTPVVEVIVNAIQAIEATKRTDGRVIVRALRSSQVELDDGLSVHWNHILAVWPIYGSKHGRPFYGSKARNYYDSVRMPRQGSHTNLKGRLTASSPEIAACLDRIARLEAENQRPQNENDRFLTQFLRWVPNAYCMASTSS